MQFYAIQLEILLFSAIFYPNPGGQMSISQKELAAILGISPATVSRALAGSKKISTATRQRILQAARQNNCSSRNNTVALLVPHSNLHGYFSEVCNLLFQELDRNGFRPLLISGRNLELIEEIDLCGAISVFAQNGLEKYWGKNQIMPLVCINTAPNHLEGIFTISSNDDQAMRTAVKHLYALGHRKIGRVAFYDTLYAENNWNSCARRTSFKKIMTELDLYPDYSGAVSDDDCFSPLKHLLDMGVTAIIVQDENLEIDILHALRCMNCHVPEDLSVISLSIAGTGKKFDPPLSTLEQNFPEMTRRCCEIFQKLLRGEKIPGDIFIDYSFISRSSTAAPPSHPAGNPKEQKQLGKTCK